VVEVHPPLVGFLTPERAASLAEEGLFADDPAGLVRAWEAVQSRWGATVQAARALPDQALHERVAGEWSFVETLRHLVFVTDAWVGDVVEEAPDPYHPWGLPPDFLADSATELGLEPEARPALDEVLTVREERVDRVRRVLSAVDPAGLERRCARRGGRYAVVGALQTVVFEEWAHHEYATRDLRQLGATGGPDPQPRSG
jgi:hypothetical protein